MRRGRDESPVVLDARVVSGSGGGPDKTILNSPRFLAAGATGCSAPTCTPRGTRASSSCGQKAQDLAGPAAVRSPTAGPGTGRVALQLLQTLPPRAGRHLARPRLQEQRARPAAAAVLAHAAGDDRARLGQAHAADAPVLRDRPALPAALRAVICVSEDLQRALPGLRRAARAAACSIENGIDTEHFSPHAWRRARRRTRLGISAERLVIGAVGRLSAGEGVRPADPRRGPARWQAGPRPRAADRRRGRPGRIGCGT